MERKVIKKDFKSDHQYRYLFKLLQNNLKKFI